MLQDKYTWAPQTLHNTPVVNILKDYFCIILFLKKRIKNQIQLNLTMHAYNWVFPVF